MDVTNEVLLPSFLMVDKTKADVGRDGEGLWSIFSTAVPGRLIFPGLGGGGIGVDSVIGFRSFFLPNANCTMGLEASKDSHSTGCLYFTSETAANSTG